MIDQLDIFSMEELSPVILNSAKDVYDILEPKLHETMRSNWLPEDWITFRNLKSGWLSVYLIPVIDIGLNPAQASKDTRKLLFRIRIRKNNGMFEISEFYTNELPERIQVHKLPQNKTQENSGFQGFTFQPEKEYVLEFASFLCNILERIIHDIVKDFDCCSRFLQCSDAKRCIHPNPGMALMCNYRQILKNGIIYYGKNRNIP